MKKPKPKKPNALNRERIRAAIIVFTPYVVIAVLIAAWPSRQEEPWCAPVVVHERTIATPLPAAPVEAIPLPRPRPKAAPRPLKKRTKIHPRPSLSPWGLPPPRYMFP